MKLTDLKTGDEVVLFGVMYPTKIKSISFKKHRVKTEFSYQFMSLKEIWCYAKRNKFFPSQYERVRFDDC